MRDLLPLPMTAGSVIAPSAMSARLMDKTSAALHAVENIRCMMARLRNRSCLRVGVFGVGCSSKWVRSLSILGSNTLGW